MKALYSVPAPSDSQKTSRGLFYRGPHAGLRPHGVVLSLLALLWGVALAQAEVPFWHTLGQGGYLEAEALGFNQAQRRYLLKPRFVGDYRELGLLLTAALRNNSAPPLLQVELSFLPVLAQAGLLQEVTLGEVGDLDPALLALGQVGGRQVGLPIGVSLALLFYNQEAFRARGLAPPRRLGDLPRVAKGLSSRAAKGFLFVADVYSFAALASAQGRRLAEGGKPRLTEGVQALNLLLAMREEGSLQVRRPTEITQAGLDFLRTKAFMVLGPSTLLPAAQARTEIPFRVGAVPIPLEPGGWVAASGAVLVALKGGGPVAKEALLAFWRYLMAPSRQAVLAEGTHYLPLSLEAQARLGRTPYGEVLLGLKPQARPWHQEAPMVLWASALERALEAALFGRLSPEAALRQAQLEAERATFP